MPLLIDAYNLLHAEKPAALAGLDEPGLCRLLERSRWAGRGITVACDGRPKPHSLNPAELSTVDLLFSGPGRSADDLILDHIAAHSAPRSLTVVTDDRRLQAAARRRRCPVQACAPFLDRLARDLHRKPPAPRPGKPTIDSLGPAHTDAWLRAFGLDPHDPS